MTNFTYKSHSIIPHCSINRATGFWTVKIEITWKADSRRETERLNAPRDGFKTKEEAETFGIELGKSWIDMCR